MIVIIWLTDNNKYELSSTYIKEIDIGTIIGSNGS